MAAPFRAKIKTFYSIAQKTAKRKDQEEKNMEERIYRNIWKEIGISDAQVEEWSHQITDQVLKLSEFMKANHILAYADYNHEVMTRYIIEEAWKAGKEVAVPKVVGKDMVFYRLTDFSQLEPGYFGIPEPVRGEIVKWEDALMVMPGVAFDPENNRVGYGGGFYDRFLEKHPDITRLAVAFDFQILDLVPTEPTDICPQIIVTQSKVYRREDL